MAYQADNVSGRGFQLFVGIVIIFFGLVFLGGLVLNVAMGNMTTEQYAARFWYDITHFKETMVFRHIADFISRLFH